MLVNRSTQKYTFKRFVKPLIVVLALNYLCFHALHGERGIYALIRDEHRLTVLEKELAETQAKREAMELRVKNFRDASLDVDLLDEQLRRNMGLTKPNELVLLISPESTSRAAH